jgi:hypothetical protein
MPDQEVQRCRVCSGESRGEDICAPCVLATTGLTYRQLDYWVRAGYLRPVRDRTGSGIARLWPHAELEIAGRMKRLTDVGLPPREAHRFAREMWPDGEIAPGIWISAEEVPCA